MLLIRHRIVAGFSLKKKSIAWCFLYSHRCPDIYKLTNSYNTCVVQGWKFSEIVNSHCYYFLCISHPTPEHGLDNDNLTTTLERCFEQRISQNIVVKICSVMSFQIWIVKINKVEPSSDVLCTCTVSINRVVSTYC